MRRLLFILLLIVPSLVYAQNEVIRNDNASTTVQGTNLQNSKISTDEKGRIFINPNQTPIPVEVSGSVPISISTPIPVYPRPAPISVVTRVPDQNTAVTCLAANADRAGAEFVNDSTEIAYLKKGATATSTDFTVRLMPQDYYYQEDGYVGAYSCIWANNSSGAMQVTETEP